MLDQFLVFLQLGFSHISDIKGYDHILFIITLCSRYPFTDWKKVTVLVTAFTLGHSVTLALSALHIIIANRYVIEILIPVTIFITGVFNILLVNRPSRTPNILSYTMALLFGLIHGLGFSNYFNELMGGLESIVFPLFSFNLGIELGQLIIVSLFMLLNILLIKVIHLKQKNWTIYISVFGAAMAVFLIFQRV